MSLFDPITYFKYKRYVTIKYLIIYFNSTCFLIIDEYLSSGKGQIGIRFCGRSYTL